MFRIIGLLSDHSQDETRAEGQYLLSPTARASLACAIAESG